MATHSSILAWRISWTERGVLWTTVHGGCKELDMTERLTLTRFVIAFLPGSKRLDIMVAVTIHSDFWTQENKVCHSFHCFPICHEVMGPDGTGCRDLGFLNV